MITEENKQKRQSRMTLPFLPKIICKIYFLKNFFRPYIPSPSRPVASKIIVAGSGTEAGGVELGIGSS
jgi:hypothetical protein